MSARTLDAFCETPETIKPSTAPTFEKSANRKLSGVQLLECPEIEQARPCEFWNDPAVYCSTYCVFKTSHPMKLKIINNCPRCTRGRNKCEKCAGKIPLITERRGEKWFKVCKCCGYAKEHVHPSTAQAGLIRLGTGIEVTPAMWHEFKSGRGVWDCCGQSWERPDFSKRPYFIVTRGLAPLSFYRELYADTLALNVQVSVDITPTGETIPNEQALKFFNSQRKTIFRFKTTPDNVRQFAALTERLGISRFRVMETPIRWKKSGHAYSQKTPLESVWSAQDFGRCNTPCERCTRENGVLLCAVTAVTLENLPRLERKPPERVTFNHEPRPIEWKFELRQYLLTRPDNTATLDEMRAYFGPLFDWLEYSALDFKIRQKIQDVAHQTGVKGTWKLCTDSKCKRHNP